MADTKKLKELTNEVIQYLDRLKAQLEQLQVVVNNRTLIDNNGLQLIVTEAINYAQLQDSLRAEYKCVFPNEPIPTLLEDIEAKIRSMDEELAKQVEFEEAKKVIIRFSSITSDFDDCKEMLKRSLERLEQIDADAMTLDEYKVSTKPYDDFYDTVLIDDLGKRTASAQNLYSFFGGDMISNLLFSKFYIVNSETEAASEEKCFEEANSSDSVTELNNEVIESTNEKIFVEDDHSVGDDKESESLDDKSDAALSFDSEILVDNEGNSNKETGLIRISLREEYGTPSIVSKKKTYPVDHKEFKNLMKIQRNKLAFISSLSNCTVNSMYEFSNTGYLDEDFQKAIELFVSAGYVDSISINPFSMVYHCSSRGLKAAKKYVQNTSGDVDFLVDNCTEVDLAEYNINKYINTIGYCGAVMPLKYLSMRICDKEGSIKYDHFEEQVKDTYSICSATCKIKESSCLSFISISVCFEKEANVAEFVSDFKRIADREIDKYDFIFIASDNDLECEHIFEYISNQTEKIKASKVVFFSIIDSKYCYNGNTVSREQVIKLIEEYLKEQYDYSIFKANPYIEEAEKSGIVVCDHSDVGKAKIVEKDNTIITAKTFKKDMKNLDYAAMTSVLSDYNSTNERFIRERFTLIAQHFGTEPITERMFEDGYVNKISVGDYPPIYQINNALEKCLSKTNVTWLKSKCPFDFRPRTVSSPEDRNGIETPYFANMVLAKIGHLNASSSLIYNKYIESTGTKIMANSFYSLFEIDIYFVNSVKARGFVLSSCIPTSDELSDFLKHFDSAVSQINDKYDIFIISAFNKVECDSYYNFIIQKYDCFKGSKYISYLISGDCFIDDKGQELSVDDIRDYTEHLYFERLSSDEMVSENREGCEEESSNTAETIFDTVTIDSDSLSTYVEDQLDPAITEGNPDSERKETVEEDEKILNENVQSEYSSDDKTNISEEIKGDSHIIIEDIIDNEQILENVCRLLGKGKYCCASAYLRALSMQNKSFTSLYTALGYAMDDPALSHTYTSSVISSIFDEDSDFAELTSYFKLCAALRTLFLSNPHDYQYKALYASVQGHEYITEENKYVADLMFNLTEFRDNTNGTGVDAYADYRIKENVTIGNMILNCVKSAQVHLIQYYENPIREKKAMPRYMDMIKMILKKDAALYDCIRAAAEDDRSEEILEYVKDFMLSNFINTDCEIRGANISSDKIDDFIDYYWVEAGKIQREKHKSSKLVQELRNNVIAMLTKMLNDIADWYYYVSLYTENDNLSAYIHEKNEILELVVDALQTCDEISNSGDRDRILKAGNSCIKIVLKEFRNKLEGSFIDNANRYYYVDFLFYGEVMLDENFIPILENELSVVNNYSPLSRILRHSDYPERDIDERIDEIFNRTADYDLYLSDDYGCATLIKEYYRLALNRTWDDENNNIEINTIDASKQMSIIRSNFIGTLELDQSYGKIDVDRKDRLLLLVDKQYEKAMQSHNFGFFKRMLDYCKHTVDENAQKREADISIQLENVRTAYSEIAEAQEMLRSAERMMTIQNYTVVEDIINRIQQRDFTSKSVLESMDYLEDFINEYDRIFRIVYHNSINSSSASLITRLTRYSSGNKHGNFAANIINNFPTDIRKLANLDKFLMAIGFNVTSVKENPEKKNCFDVTLKKPLNGKRDNYLHPIYLLGSYAMENGFRVLCTFGKTDYNNILDSINEIGTSKSTILLVNWALELYDRRELARKIKAKMPDDKIFIVIDRVAMYYLADKNEESTSSINRILMQITVPFATFQPYTEDASKAIPSEMFMGRTKLLRDIESPKGANVICGGRQLGKSALLRMAKSDINDDFEGNRAVYVEIKNLDYKQSALKVSQELIDAQILDSDCITDDWDRMARYIKLRLNDEQRKRIPFFLLLIDEADVLFETSKDDDYKPIRALETLQTDSNQRFKFVFAGLRNLVKFERELATDANSTLPHITVKTIRPFSSQEARELLEIPLHYLGVRFPKDKEYLVSLILASTNYFPGLIHQYCASLIKALQEKDYADYTVDKTPPYELTETQIKKILSDENFTNEIKRKFDITLKLDTDNYYDIIATLVAYCCYNEESANGFTAQDIMEVAESYEIYKIISQGLDKLNALMEELCELNILRKNNENRYLFARHNFIQMLGKDKTEIDEKLLQYLGV